MSREENIKKQTALNGNVKQIGLTADVKEKGLIATIELARCPFVHRIM